MEDSLAGGNHNREPSGQSVAVPFDPEPYASSSMQMAFMGQNASLTAIQPSLC